MTRKHPHTDRSRRKRRRASPAEPQTPAPGGPQPPSGRTLLELLACDLSDDVVDEALERPLDFGRNVEL